MIRRNCGLEKIRVPVSRRRLTQKVKHIYSKEKVDAIRGIYIAVEASATAVFPVYTKKLIETR